MFQVKEKVIPIWEKEYLTLAETAEYTGVGIKRLRALAKKKGCNFVMWNYGRLLFKRKKLEEFLEKSYSV